jgi:hypothetical protein
MAYIGADSGDAERLKDGLATHHRAALESTHAKNLMAWITTHFDLREALEQLGTLKNDSAYLEQAAIVYREGLREWEGLPFREFISPEASLAQRGLKRVTSLLGESLN